MTLHAKEKLVSKQYEYLFFTVLQSTLQTGTEDINGRLRNVKH